MTPDGFGVVLRPASHQASGNPASKPGSTSYSFHGGTSDDRVPYSRSTSP